MKRLGFWWDRRLPSGYTDMGKINIPVRPQAFILTDRTTGVQWMVSFETNPDRIGITDDMTLQKNQGARVYDKDSGPAVGTNGQYMLTLDNGRLAIIDGQLQGDETYYSNELPYARQFNDQRLTNVDVDNIKTLHIGIVSP